MFTLMVVLCLVADPTVCTAPIEVVPEAGKISSMGQCLRGGAIYGAQKGEEMGGEWFAKTYCRQKSLADFAIWLKRESKKSRLGQADGVARSPWN